MVFPNSHTVIPSACFQRWADIGEMYDDAVHLRTKLRPRALVSPVYTMQSNSSGTWIEIELPGVPESSVDIDATGNVLTVRAVRAQRKLPVAAKDTESDVDATQAETKDKHPAKDKAVQPKTDADTDDEKMTYQVAFRVPREYDMEGINAAYENGLLKLEIPQSARVSTSRKIAISSADREM